MINVLIVEDEERSSNVLERMLTDYCPGIHVTGVARNIADARQLIATHKPRLVFLDIQLPDGNSFSLLNEHAPEEFKIIFITAHNDYALKALKCAAVDYLLKPLNIDELVTAVKKVALREHDHVYAMGMKALQENAKIAHREKMHTIGLSTLSEIHFIPTDDIIRLEAASNYTHFFVERAPKITVSHTIKYYEDILDNGQFMRVHQSHMINLRKVRKYIKGKVGSIVMTDGCTIDVSPKNKEELLSALNLC